MINPLDVMTECAQLALMGKGLTKTNPIVGAAVVKNGRVIGRGFHSGFGMPHAEVEAIESCTEAVDGADLYVTLEPCSHHGKTPPCTSFIIEKKIRRVFVGVADPNPVNAGNGLNELMRAGIQVFLGYQEDLCAELLEDFAKLTYTKLPYVIGKAAESADGKIALKDGSSKWISSASSRDFVHYLRSVSDAVAVGVDSVINDDPALNVRGIFSEADPLKVVFDSNLRINKEAQLIHRFGEKTIIFACREGEKDKVKFLEDHGVRVIFVKENNGRVDIKDALSRMPEMNIMNLLVEGGGNLLGSFYKEKMIDRLMLFIAPKIFGGEGISAFQSYSCASISDERPMKLADVKRFENDIMCNYKINDYTKPLLELTEKLRNRCLLGL